jgi:predicted hydrocarbon binding protein
MKRKDFFKNVCKYGLCSCAAFTVLGREDAYASGNDQEQEIKNLQWKLDFINKRFAKLLEIFNSTLEDEKKAEILENLGRECAKEFNEDALRYKGNVKGYLEEVMKKWVEKVEYDNEKGVIRIFDKEREKCFCPFIDGSPANPDNLCYCSMGWQKEIYETLTGKPVDVKVTDSILKGGKRCSFEIVFG